MVDIVERLRDTTGIHENLIYEAADEIERLREYIEAERNIREGYVAEVEKQDDEIERLRERVKELATALEFEANYGGHKALARAALKESK